MYIDNKFKNFEESQSLGFKKSCYFICGINHYVNNIISESPGRCSIKVPFLPHCALSSVINKLFLQYYAIKNKNTTRKITYLVYSSNLIIIKGFFNIFLKVRIRRKKRIS